MDVQNFIDKKDKMLLLLQQYFSKLQVLNFAGIKPMETLEIQKILSEMDSLGFKPATNFDEFVRLYAQIQNFEKASDRIMHILKDVNLVKDINSSYTETEKLQDELRDLQKQHNAVQKYFQEHNVLHNFSSFVGEITPAKVFDILSRKDAAQMAPLVQMLLITIPINDDIIAKVQVLKNEALEVKVLKSENKNTIQKLIQTQNLVVATPRMPLADALKLIGIKAKSIKDLTSLKKHGFIIIFKIAPIAIDSDIHSLFDRKYVLEHKLYQPAGTGISMKTLQRFDTVKFIKPEASDKIMYINRSARNHVLETVDGINFNFLKHIFSDSLLVEDFVEHPSARLLKYNQIINAEIFKKVKTPYIVLNDSFNVEKLERSKNLIKVQLMEELDSYLKKKKNARKFFENYKYENLLYKSAEAITENLPTQYIMPYINNEFKYMYLSEIYKFSNKLKTAIMRELGDKNLTRNDIEIALNAALRQNIVRDKKNLFISLAQRLELILSLL